MCNSYLYYIVLFEKGSAQKRIRHTKTFCASPKNIDSCSVIRESEWRNIWRNSLSAHTIKNKPNSIDRQQHGKLGMYNSSCASIIQHEQLGQQTTSRKLNAAMLGVGCSEKVRSVKYRRPKLSRGEKRWENAATIQNGTAFIEIQKRPNKRAEKY